MTSAEKNASIIKSTAKRLGFDFCGIAKAGFLEEEAPKLEDWLNRNYNGEMGYLANHFDKRLDPTKLVEGAKTVVSLIYNYYPAEELQSESSAIKLAKYAYGEDYHFVIRDKLNEFLEILRDEIGEIDGRSFVDSAPVMERQWAQKAGLGWLGKNSLLLNRKQGSFFFLSELIIDLEVSPDTPLAKDYCGTCTACIDACPTDAIVGNGVIDGSRCISYLTIELKDAIPDVFKGKMENWAFGCDICQDVCPWNRFSKPNQEPRFQPSDELKELTKSDWKEITEETFRRVFKKSAVKRTKLVGLNRNIDFLNSK
ncbi:epoxyqueuosine reductase [Algoriphagus ratkowskyi]|uniref:Epoxyqueuosine reductase n=1 Tax=Algoriphagus ratkowskyi TaxID=57028 RepID=A0A2W7RHQ4_9BACT|nr:tRNA epoxyqueuosine(34) reductase QueG [Algoriphagus ratkowskyi]PZX59924.1 epoxyqueuosine reductase [Algoriphagus ratkowskyi]TXD78374.1 tRNA epoxyqueuosine(34) reductase QueG [Algoriphagus ratkowskyi]